jgi:hypothetical protein
VTWAPRWHHVSQVYRHTGDPPGRLEGASDCFEACLARYLRESRYSFAGDDEDLIAYLRQRITGQPDHAGQPGTLLSQASASLPKLGVHYRWTFDLADALAQPWAILWVRAIRLRLSASVLVSGVPQWVAYSSDWVGPGVDPDHFILRMPDGRFNDPLAWYVGDCGYSATSLCGAFGGAYVLEVVDLPDDAAATWIVADPAGVRLREWPGLQAPILETVPHGAGVVDVYDADCTWRFVTVGGKHGWMLRELLSRRS